MKLFAPVTPIAKCYVYVCAGCGLLADSERSDTLTCSNRCRVQAHRNGSLKALRSQAAAYDLRPSLLAQASAAWRLCPELSEQILVGKLSLDDARPQIWQAFMKQLFAEVNAT